MKCAKTLFDLTLPDKITYNAEWKRHDHQRWQLSSASIAKQNKKKKEKKMHCGLLDFPTSQIASSADLLSG